MVEWQARRLRVQRLRRVILLFVGLDRIKERKRRIVTRPPARKPTQVERTVYNVTGNIARDLTMGLSTFGQSKEKQAETLRSKGYSDDVIKDYQDRTAASQERMRQQMARNNDDDNDRRQHLRQ